MKTLRQLLILLMILAMSAPLLVACDEEAVDVSQSSISQSVGESSSSGEESEVNNDILPEVKQRSSLQS